MEKGHGYESPKGKALAKEDLRRDLRIDEIASRLNLSSSRLRHLIKDETGITLSQYRKKLRMQKAKHLLETTFLNVKEIMLKVGFKDESNFVKDFKKYYGLSPSKYRTSYWNEVENKSLKAVAASTNK